MYIKKYTSRTNLLLPICAVITSIIFSYLFFNGGHQEVLAYYLSASLNDLSLTGLSFSNEEAQVFNRLAGVDITKLNHAKLNYIFKQPGNPATIPEIVEHFGYLVSIGFLIYLKILRVCFGWITFIGDVPMVLIGNMLIHVACLAVYSKFNLDFSKRFIFIAFYFLNPIIVILYTFPYYYYLTVLPSLVAVYLYHKGYNINRIATVIIFITLLFSLLVRPTLVFGLLFIFLVAAVRSRKFYTWFYCITYLMLAGLFLYYYKLMFGPWHSIYIGAGAYPNGFALSLSDSSSASFLDNIKGVYNSEQRLLDPKDSMILLKREALRLINLQPLLYAENSIKNILQLYGFGYSTKLYWFQYFSMAMGILFLSASLANKLYFHILVILFLNIGYIFYFPPVPVYMAGSYFILTHGWIEILSKVYIKYRKKY